GRRRKRARGHAAFDFTIAPERQASNTGNTLLSHNQLATLAMLMTCQGALLGCSKGPTSDNSGTGVSSSSTAPSSATGETQSPPATSTVPSTMAISPASPTTAGIGSGTASSSSSGAPAVVTTAMGESSTNSSVAT